MAMGYNGLQFLMSNGDAMEGGGRFGPTRPTDKHHGRSAQRLPGMRDAVQDGQRLRDTTSGNGNSTIYDSQI